MIFSHNTPTEHHEALANVLGVQVVDRHERYVGLPAAIGRSKNVVFQNLNDKVRKNYRVGSAKIFPKLGIYVLLKSVMSCFLILASTCQVIKGLMVDFPWPNKDVKKIHWLAWNKVLFVRKRSFWP
ncbi:hypothetical protein Sango_1609000 [Sesamum angolense]|uniref:Uncharacterized protein n=1 Tax=Sesamum angolense TaxID=2727404 RepID=A0AAE2BQX4_9LAMI|nr:hypothetical protein Sango_1609000 [Sesamum angolense]